MKSSKRPQDQTIEEWLADYENHNAPSLEDNEQEKCNRTRVFQYIGHRTFDTKGTGRLALEFRDINDETEIVCFFNVDIRIMRGTGRGGSRKLGKGGIFWPSQRGEFRKFWMGIIGKEPYRWSRAHKELKPRLSKFLFKESIFVERRKEDTKTTYLQVHHDDISVFK